MEHIFVTLQSDPSKVITPLAIPRKESMALKGLSYNVFFSFPF